jgi:heterodisulfide reductase subunit B
MGTIENVGLRLNYILLKEAHKRGANCIATVCPLCQFNLEAYQRKILEKENGLTETPVLYFTQLVGLALGVPAQKLGLQRAMVTPKYLVESLEATPIGVPAEMD